MTGSQEQAQATALMAEIEAGLEQRIDVLLARLDLELEALADQAGDCR